MTNLSKPAPRLPDRTGMLILPASVFVACAWIAIVVAWDALEIDAGTHRRSRHAFAREQLASDMLGALARALGLGGSIALAIVLVGASAAWLGWTIRAYLALRAADRAALGKPR
jgi:hypothetical protein